jgi:hypothetical protein
MCARLSILSIFSLDIPDYIGKISITEHRLHLLPPKRNQNPLPHSPHPGLWGFFVKYQGLQEPPI